MSPDFDKIGKKVKYGNHTGEIVSIDLPDSRNWRYVLKMEGFGEMPLVCFFPEEIEFL